MKKLKIGLLGKILIAIALGIGVGLIAQPWMVRTMLTFNGIFSEFLGFAIPLIILGLVTPAISDIGKTAGKMLLITVAIAYGSTVLSGLLSYFTGATLFPGMISSGASLEALEASEELTPFFTVDIPPLMAVMTALILSFTL
jgi:Na+/H+-dicarboxylate symporter